MLYPIKQYLFYVILLSFTIQQLLAIHCRTGVGSVNGPFTECSGSQCLNTTKRDGDTVYACDFSHICDVIILHNKCHFDSKEKTNVCCCNTMDNCNGAFIDPKSKITKKIYARKNFLGKI